MSDHSHYRKVFFCHSTYDKPLVQRIASFMKEVGIQVWYDDWEIGWGDSIVEKVNQALDSSSNLVVFLSSAAVSSHWVRRELSAALMKQLQEHDIRVLPVKLEDCPVPALLGDIRWVSLTRPHSYRTGLSTMVSVLAPEIESQAIMGRFAEVIHKFFPETVAEWQGPPTATSCPSCGGPALRSYAEQRDAPVWFKFYRGIQCEQCGRLFIEHEPEHCESCKIAMRWKLQGSSEGSYGAYEQDYAWECPRCGWLKWVPRPR